jgi:GntR family transcriptional regulator/MocR family aminotransferase
MPRGLADRAAELKAALDGGSPVPEQIALASMIETAAFERHVRRARVEYGRRREALLDALGTTMPRARITGQEAGLHLAARLPAPVDRAGLEHAALGARIRMFMLESFMHDPPAEGSSLLIGYGRLPAAAAEAAVTAVADVLGPVSRARRGTVAGLPRSGSVAPCPPPSTLAASG